MVLLVHMLFGAAVGNVISHPLLAVVLALLGHYFLDLFPHVEYSIINIRNKNWNSATADISKVIIDFCLGIITIVLLAKNQPIIFLCAFVALIPDTLTVITDAFPNKILNIHDRLHTQKVHYLTNQKKFPFFWRIATQAVSGVLSLWLLGL